MKTERKVITVCVAIVTIMALAIVVPELLWRLSPSRRASIIFRQCKFAPLPQSASAVQHKGKRHAFTGNDSSQWISFSTTPEDAKQFLKESPIMTETYTMQTTNGYEGAVDSCTAWRLQINTNQALPILSISIWDCG